MAGPIRRLRVAWSGGGVIGDSVSTFYSLTEAPDGFPAAVRAFFAASPLLFPDDVTITVPNNGDVIESSTGALVGSWVDGAAPAPVVGTNSGDFARGVGMQIRWNTGQIVNGRRLVGSTFLVPIAAGVFDTDGTLDTATVSERQSAANALIAAQPNLVIWSRPKPAGRGKNHNLPEQVGVYKQVLTAQVPDRVSWLRSRRT